MGALCTLPSPSQPPAARDPPSLFPSSPPPLSLPLPQAWKPITRFIKSQGSAPALPVFHLSYRTPHFYHPPGAFQTQKFFSNIHSKFSTLTQSPSTLLPTPSPSPRPGSPSPVSSNPKAPSPPYNLHMLVAKPPPMNPGSTARAPFPPKTPRGGPQSGPAPCPLTAGTPPLRSSLRRRFRV